MYDELIKNLRNYAEVYKLTDNENTLECSLLINAADAIEELQAQLMYSNDAAKAIAEKVPKWIPVTETERLPDDDVPVQACYIDYNSRRLKSDLLACRYEDNWCYWDSESHNKCKVIITHWMPLQEPPEEET